MTRALAGERIGVLGLARSGRAAARLALARGATVYASDAGDGPAAREAAEELRGLGAEVETGGHDLERLAGCDRIVLSPGIPPDAPVLRDPGVRLVPVVPELEFAAEQLEVPLVVITGTNGKTTTTALTEHLLRSGGVRVEAGGNIGRALSEVALLSPVPEVVVVEASSFQLGGVRALKVAVGVVTNLAPDHLDRYPSTDAYYADKARLFTGATEGSRWVLNGEDDAVLALPGDAPGRRYLFRASGPAAAGEEGGYLRDDGMLVLRLEGRDEPLLRAHEISLLGPHNVANGLAAALAARLVGGGVEGIRNGLRDFAALEHRLEPVAEVDGVLWINDSKATNLASTRVAIRAMTRPTVLLLGGRHKGEPYTGLLPDLAAGAVREIVAYGEAAAIIAEDLGASLPVARVAGGFDDAVRVASQHAAPGDAVLLSPACSSYDMFEDYEARGRRFRELVTWREG